MNVTFCCAQCDQSSRLDVTDDQTHLDCPHCGSTVRFPPSAWEAGRLHRCLICPSTDLYVRKDFPQRLGVALVVTGILGSSIAWYYQHVFFTFAILFATALIDVVLFFLVGNALMCYRCFAQYRGLEHMEEHGPFDLETHERYRQASARQREHAPRADRTPSAHEPLPDTPASQVD